MEFNSGEQDKESTRRKKRKQERMMAIAVLAGGVLVICIIITCLISSFVHMLSSNKKSTKTSETVQEEQAQAIADSKDLQSTDENSGSLDTKEKTESNETDSVENTDIIGTGDETETTDSDLSEEANNDSGLTDDLLTGDKDNQAELDAMVSEQIASMTIEQKVAALFFVTPEQLLGKETGVTAVGSEVMDKIQNMPVGGIMLNESNITDEEGLRTLIDNIQTMASNSLFIGIEDTGGESSPFITKGLSENILSSEQEIGASLGSAGAYSTGISIGSELKQYGINVDFAPLADVSLKEGSVAQKNGFGTDKKTTAELTKNMVKGLTDQNIHSAVKYFPSYGDATQDGNSGQVISQRSLEDLKGEAEPYLEAIDAGSEFVMISHVSLPKVRGDNRPASLSSEVITDIVRNEWGYDGIVITDFMDKSCMYQKYTYAESAVGAIEAGADMILTPKNLEKSYNGILDAVKGGKISEDRINESLTRIYRVKFKSWYVE